jgi:hypothetical protein
MASCQCRQSLPNLAVLDQAAPLRGAEPGRASRRACGTYGADPARRGGLSLTT